MSKIAKRIFCFVCVILTLPATARTREIPSPGFGYPGNLAAYQVSKPLSQSMSRFGMSAGWFKRNELPADYVRLQTPQVNELPYLLYVPKQRTKPVPMVVYFGGTGEQGTDLSAHFRQTTLFERLTSKDFQKQHPCYIFAPMLPKGSVIRAALPGDRSMMADLVCDAMYAVIAAQHLPSVDTNRLYVTGLSWGGVAAFELTCSFPGRFSATVPTSCIQSPLRIPRDHPGNYWMLYNEKAYKSEWSQAAIREIERLVTEGHGEFRSSTFPDDGHDAWRKAWCEDAVWEWVFSKGTPQMAHERRPPSEDKEGFRQISNAICTSSIPGKDERHGPERILDGLDATFYLSKVDAKRNDWVMVTFKNPVTGKFVIHSGRKDGSGIISNGWVEVSEDGKRWSRIGTFSKKEGIARIKLRSAVKMIRLVYIGSRPQPLVLRKIVREDK